MQENANTDLETLQNIAINAILSMTDEQFELFLILLKEDDERRRRKEDAQKEQRKNPAIGA